MPMHDLFHTHSGLEDFLKVERASLMWVSNQSDDLLCLPYCAVDQLEYQVRTALRVTGALRGRALLSDEVGLGKTIEAGLVLKEYLTRGLVRRFLVLTVPSLIDQWAEELESKFGLKPVTSNQAQFRNEPERFWTEESALIASIHTFKQDTHLALAARRPWDMVIVDEAQYLRNRTSRAWQAVNALPRQFVLLLTATPVQNSLEDLYNLVTLLKPGHLPSPKEFRQRFINRDRPYEPREPEQLRQLLGQVMIRNTRANAGIQMPSRRAETVLYEPEPEEREFWQEWGGALLLTRSGTEGRNLQFCHRLVNFDLPWNPMEIEQRIGRLHRIGQNRVVEIYNLVQAGTLQAHLLDILQEKLNLFDLVVGETGLILGERFTSEDFEEEIFRRWQVSGGDFAGALKSLGEELSRSRAALEEIKHLDETLFAHDYEST